MRISSIFRRSDQPTERQFAAVEVAMTEAAATERVERRRRVLRCIACNVWSETLVYMRNGADYCVPCAGKLRDAYGTQPAGRRASDIKHLPN
jgi:hypothetical protein